VNFIYNFKNGRRMDVTPHLAPSRRRLLGLAAPLALALAGLPTREAEAALRERSLVMHHTNTGETLKTVYWADGVYRRDSLAAVNRLFRDWRQNEVHSIDPKLLDLLWALRGRLETRSPIQVLCGYRTPETNAMLRRMHRGAARNSLHLVGMAVDLRVPGRSLGQLRAAATSLKGGGVGYYPRSDFVHVDTGPVRYW
jgi:uncharacterized protein YcbK (DUF882 family)